MKTTKFKTVDDYFISVPSESLARMKAIRDAIKKAAPHAEEIISYNMPAIKYNGVLVYFAAYEKHIGFYPTPSAISRFGEELSGYHTAKGSVQFPHDKPLPLDLISRMTKYRYEEKLKES
jgi:uncharacterized protein YdhG (YjbR/CyaY superfamily)